MADEQEIAENDIQVPQQDDPKSDGGPGKLSDGDRERLAGIVQKMKDNGESDDNIKTAVEAFKTKYAPSGGDAPSPPSQAPAPPSQIPRFDSAAFGKKVMKDNAPASESTAGGSTKIIQDLKGQDAAAEQERKIQAKYKPLLDKAMSDIDNNRSLYVDNKRPALDNHHDAPDSFYDLPKTKEIDEYLKANYPDTDTRYYLRNRILASFQQKKDEYNTGQIAQTHIEQLPAVQQARQEASIPENIGKPEVTGAILKRAAEIDPTIPKQVGDIYQNAAKKNEDIKNENARLLMNNSTSLSYDDNGNLRKVNTLDPNTPFHDQITGAGKAVQGVMNFVGDVGQMASGVMNFFGAKNPAYGLQTLSDDFKTKNNFPGGNQTLSEFLGGSAVPMILQGQAMGNFARGLGSPIFKALSGASARGLIGKFAEGALGGVALAPINSAIIAHDFYTQDVRNGEAPEIAHAKAERVFGKNLVTDMVISPLQFGIMNAPAAGAARALLQYGVSPTVAGVHFMAQDYFQQKENNPALTAWKYATSPEGMKTGITGALTGLLQHFAIGKMNDWQNDKTVKDAFSFGRKDSSPETGALPNNNVLASTVLNAFEMKDNPKRAGELSGLVDELHQKGVYNDQEAAKINGIIADVAAVKDQVPKMGTSPQRMAVFNELLNKKAYQDQMGAAGNSAVTDMLEGKMKDSDNRIQSIMNGEEPLYFINGNETSKEQLTEWVENNPDLVRSKAVNIDIINDDETKQAIQDAKNQPFEQEPAKSGGKEAAPGEEVPAEAKTGVTEVRHAITAEDEKGVTSGPTDIRLNEEGKAQADKLGDEMTGKEVKKVLSSGLPRAAETAQIVADKLGVPHGTIPQIKSWDIGEFDKMKDANFKKAEEYLVQHPDEKEFEGKKVLESFNEYKDRVIAAREKIEKDAVDHTLVVNGGGNIKVWDAYQKNGRKWNTQAANDYLNAPDLEPAALRQPVQEAAKPVELPDRTPEFSKFYNDFKDEIGAVKDSSFDFRVDLPMDQKAREGAVKDIEKGKETKRAKLFLDELQKQHDAGVIEYTRGRGNHVEKFGIPIEEWGKLQEAAEPEVLKDIESGELPADELAKWLQEEADKIIENEPERAEGETGHASGESEAGTSEGKLLHPVQEVDEAKAGTRSDTSKDESRPAGDRAEGSVGKTGAAEGGQHGQGETAEDLEASEAVAELARRLGKKTGKMDRLSQESIPVGDKDNTAEQYLSKAKSVLKQLFPSHEIRAYDTEAEYMEKEGRPAGSAGVYDPEGKYIALNLERIRKQGAENTIFHEVIHPIVREALQSRPGAVDAAYSRLVDMKDIPGMEAVWQHEEKYRDRGLDTMKVEAITEFLSRVADGSIDPTKFTPSIRTKIIDAVNKIFKAIGVKKVISSAQDISRLAYTIKKAFSEADATPVKAALGRRPEDIGNNKMESLKPDDKEEGKEDDKTLIDKFLREKINEYKEPSLIDALTKSGGMTEDEAKAMIQQVRDEQNMSPEDIIRQAMEIGKAKGKGVGNQIMAPMAADNMKPSLMKTLRRWYFDGKDEVSDVKSIIRKNKGAEEFEIDKIYHATKKLVNDWNKVPKVKQMAFMLGMEKPEFMAGQPQKVKDMAAMYKGRLDKTFETIGKVLPDLNYIEDYFPHFWEKPEQARNFFASTLAKAPLEGGKSFAKKRFFETIVAGLKENYKLTTTNPEEMVRLAEANAWKFKTAHDIFNDMKKAGYLKYSMTGDKPEDWKTVQDPLFIKIAAALDKNGNPDLVRGAFYMPPDVADMVEDYLSPGMKGKFLGPVKNIVQTINNVKNAFQLGFGWFHGVTTSIESSVSGVTIGLQKLSAGKMSGLIDIATLGNLPATVWRGIRATKEWKAGTISADTQALMNANAKILRQKMYSLDAAYNMKKAFGALRNDFDFSQFLSDTTSKKLFANPDVKNAVKLAFNTAMVIPELVNRPIMEKWVPWLKVGGYLRALDAERESRGNMTPAELQTAKEKVWDSMDDRLGQVVYDNAFMNKMAKDLGFLSIRSLGWTGGTIRVLGKGIGEIPLSAKRLLKGQGITQRTAYLPALVMVAGTLGGTLNYMLSGQMPQEAEDYFWPWDGTYNPDGTKHRVQLPTYLKDILSYGRDLGSVFKKGEEAHPFETISHKGSPLITDIVDVLKNKDFYGEKLYNKDDPFYQKGLDVLKYEGESFTPFSFKKNPNDTAPWTDQFTTSRGLLQKFGVMPAPAERSRSDIQNRIMREFSDQIGKDEGKTHDEMVKQIAKRHLHEFLFNGGDWDNAPEDWKKDAGIQPMEIGRFIKESHIDPFERAFKQLKTATKIKLYNEMTDEEKGVYGHWIPIKDRSAANAPKPDDE